MFLRRRNGSLHTCISSVIVKMPLKPLSFVISNVVYIYKGTIFLLVFYCFHIQISDKVGNYFTIIITVFIQIPNDIFATSNKNVSFFRQYTTESCFAYICGISEKICVPAIKLQSCDDARQFA